MAGVTGNPYANNRHADVLNEEPTDDAAKLRLAEEVKNRAKGAFSQKDMPSAELLYGKVITLLGSMPGKQEAALYSNRSMVRLNLNKVEEALDDARKCLEVDPKFVKGYHRKATALLRLSEWDDAIAAAEAGQKLEPDNKAFAELVEKARQDKAKDEEDKSKLKRDAQDVRVELHNASTARSSQPKKKAEGEGEEDMSMRGYKTRADGKKTSYFHTDISDEAKALIEAQGFGKPQKLEGDSAAAAAGADEAKGGGSAWNQAGTYEEKTMTKWVQERLSAGFVGKTFTVPTGAGGTLKVTAVEDLKGDASISVSRGKRRRLLDLSFAVPFEATVGDGTGKAKLLFSEVTSMADEAPEVTLEVDLSTPPSIREVLDAFAKPAGQGLQPVLMAELKKIVAEYGEK